MSVLPDRLFRPRGWLLVGAGLLALGAAALLGRRDLLLAAVFLLILPPLASLGLRLFTPGFRVRRTFTPSFVETGGTARVTLEVSGSTPGGATARLLERLPPHLIDVPTFDYPHPRTPHGRLSRYDYVLHPTRRGVFTIGPLTANFADPFDVAVLRRRLDAGNALTVAPAAIALAEITLSGGRGQDGSRRTRLLANPSDDDVMNREFRHGDPLRRIHWPATARQAKLMVRAEESVTTPEAALIFDQRMAAYGGTVTARQGGQLSSDAFEWAVVAAISVATHLLERQFSLRLVNHDGDPAFAGSPSAPEPAREDFSGPGGVLSVAVSLAALGLTPPRPHEPPAALAPRLASRLVQTRRRGPLLAITGMLSDADARTLAATAESAELAVALLVGRDTAALAGAAGILRRAGWHAVVAAPHDSLAALWLTLDAPSTAFTPGART